MQIKKLLAHNSNYGSIRNTNLIKYIVIHYTANKGDKAISNCKYFQSPNRGSSAHYFVDENEIYLSVEDNVVAWSVGGNKYPSFPNDNGGKFYGKCTNNNSISIEMCDSVDSVPEKVKDNVKELVLSLMKKYNIPKENVITHYMVTGKICPKPLIDKKAWNEFRDYITSTSEKYTVQKVKVDLFGEIKMVDTINIDNTNHIKLRDLNCNKIKVEWKNGNVYVNGKVFKVDGILYQDNNYVKIRSLEQIEISVTWDNTKKIITIK